MKRLTSLFVATCIAASCAPGASATGIFLAPLSKWKEGKLVWYYNPQYTPAAIGDEFFLDSVREAFDKWAKGCNIAAEYGGLTTQPANPRNWINSGQVTIGFYPFENDNASGRGGLVNPAEAGFATAGIAALNTARVNWEPGNAFKMVLLHEIGHLLGLGHTLYPYSIMYAQTTGGINSHSIDPFGEDYTTCASLYGSKGLVERPYYGGAFVPDPAYGISVALENRQPDPLAPQDPPLARLDLSVPGQTVYKVIRAPQQSDTSAVDWRLVAPSGDLVDPGHYALDPDERSSLHYGGMFWMSTQLPTERHLSVPFLPALNGNWRLQATVGGKPAAEFRFETVNGGIAPDERFLEMALIVESSGDRFSARTTHLDALGLARVDYYLNGDHTTPTTRFLAPSGASVLELWGKSDLPRPSECIPQETPDVVRYLHFLDADGKLAENKIGLVESGNLQSYSANATLETARSGAQQVFAVLYAGDAVLYRQADGSWAPQEHALFTFTAPGAASFDVVRNLDSYTMPAGAQLVVAYGASLADAVAKRQSALVRTFDNGSPEAAQPLLADYRDNYTLNVRGGIVTVTRRADGSMRQYAQEQRLRFLDREISFDLNGVPGQAYRLYQAAFNRSPDAAGLGHWIGALEDGASLASVAAAFQDSAEFHALYGANLSNAAWITQVYSNVLHRVPDAAGLAWWVDRLNQGADRAATLVGFSESAENRDNLSPAYADGIEYVRQHL